MGYSWRLRQCFLARACAFSLFCFSLTLLVEAEAEVVACQLLSVSQPYAKSTNACTSVPTSALPFSLTQIGDLVVSAAALRCADREQGRASDTLLAPPHLQTAPHTVTSFFACAGRRPRRQPRLAACTSYLRRRAHQRSRPCCWHRSHAPPATEWGHGQPREARPLTAQCTQ